jgi:uncharacterized membrane protein
MSPTAWIVLLWLGFAGSHLLLSHLPLRQRVIAAVGDQPFQGLYSLVSLLFFVPLVWVYFANIHAGPWLWLLPHGTLLTWIVNLGMGVAFVLLAAGLLRPSPASMMAGDAVPVGAFRITRHPVIMSMGLFGTLHLLANSSTADVAFFAGFPIFALLGCWHQDRRKLVQNVPNYAAFVADTPFVPFTRGGVLQGVREMGPLPIGVGVALAVAVRWAHRFWMA